MKTKLSKNQIKTAGDVVRSFMRQAKQIKNPKHGQLLFGRFQRALKHLSVPLRDSANREFRRTAGESSP